MAELSTKADNAAGAHVCGPDEVAAPPLAPAEDAIDRTHLERMTQGERELEREVLALFAAQASILLTRMRGATPAAAAALAHTLNGSARGIGAWQVAEAAAAVEGFAAEYLAAQHLAAQGLTPQSLATAGRDTAAAVERLASAVRAARSAIVELSHS